MAEAITGESGFEAAQQKVAAGLPAMVGACGQNLLMLALSGPASGAELDPDAPHVNLLVVLQDAGTDACKLLREPLQSVQSQLRCAPLVLSREELERGADVFPEKFHEIRRAYRVIHGPDLLASLPIEFRDLRLACEHDLRNIAVRLRRAWLLDSPRPAPLMWVLTAIVPELLGVLRIVLEHQGLRVGVGPEALVTEVARRYDADAQQLEAAIRLRSRPDAEWPEVEAAYELVVRLTELACKDVDRWTSTSSGS
jgi:hypothetical protein